MKIPARISKMPFIWELRKILLYSLYSAKAVWHFKKVGIIWTSVTNLPIWWKHKKRDNNPLHYDRPWITFNAKEFLDTLLNKQTIVFEYGSGSSTLYFARRVQKIYSIENDKLWFEYLTTFLNDNHIANVDYQLIEGNSNNNNSVYVSSSSIYKNINFEDYVKSIDVYPDDHFDIIVVDGRARNACIKHAVSKLKKNGYLLVDNSERKEYFKGNDFLFNSNEWRLTSFIGPTPYTFGFSQTSFFQKK